MSRGGALVQLVAQRRITIKIFNWKWSTKTNVYGLTTTGSLHDPRMNSQDANTQRALCDRLCANIGESGGYDKCMQSCTPGFERKTH